MKSLIRHLTPGLLLAFALSSGNVLAGGGLPVVTLSIDHAAADEAGQNPATFTITRSNLTNQTLSVNYQFSGSATENVDYSPDVFIFGGSASIPANQTSLTVNLVPTLDNFIENQETIELELLAGNGYTLGASFMGAMTLDDDVAEVTLSIDDASADEAGQDPATFTITRSNAGKVADGMTVNYQFTGTATENIDYSPDVFIFGGGATIPPGSLSLTVNLVPNLDNFIENQETIHLELLAGSTYNLGGSISGPMTLDDDVAEVTLSIDDASADEAGRDPATFTITRSNAGKVADGMTVNYQFTGTATENIDYSPDVFIFGGGATIPPGSLSLTVNLVPNVDGPDNEGDETIELELLAGSHYTLGAQTTGSMILADLLDFLFADSFEATPVDKSCSPVELADDNPGRFFDQGAFIVDLDSGLVWHRCGLTASYDWLRGGCLQHKALQDMSSAERLGAFNAGQIGDNAGYADWRRPSGQDQTTLPGGCEGLLVRDE